MEALTRDTHRLHPIHVEEDVGALRRAVATLAAGCAAVRPGEAELVATELATNLVRHAAAGGYVLSRPLDGGIELLAVDRGPGLRHLDGWRSWEPSTSRGQGLSAGLAGVERLASTFDLYSTRGAGTVVLARLGRKPPDGPLRWGDVSVPLEGETVSGDAWAVALDDALDGALAAVLVDGLGHGHEAHLAARAALSAFGQRPLADVQGFLQRAHQAMRGTRGGVIGACAIEPAAGRLTFVGVGNVAGRVLLEGSESLLSREGTIGTQLALPPVHPVRRAWQAGATLVLASDGLRSRWDPLSYPGLPEHDPSVVAATLHRDHGRQSDDATVLVVQDRRRRE